MTNPNEPQIDLTELAAKLIQENIKNVWDCVVSAGAKVSTELRYHLHDVFSKYLQASVEKYGKIKTILYRNAPVPLYQLYVPVHLKSKNDTIRSADIAAVQKLTRHIVITGTAGIGKSVFLKHLFLNAIKSGLSIPIFLELRRLNNVDLDLMELLTDSLQLGNSKVQVEHVQKAFESGKFTLLFDAYDEVISSRRQSVRDAILKLADRYPMVRMIISSRPDTEFAGWSAFSEYSALPLDKAQALALVKKVDFDEEVKGRFLRKLEESLFAEHQSFLSNPLLLTIMLMTYHDNAEIPKKRHLFFAQVFETLFSHHDAMKEGYKREIKSGLAMDDFQRALSALSIQCYLKGQVTLPKTTALEYAKKAASLTNLKFDSEAFIDDLLKSVCLLIHDGVQLAYAHKQFQEYYVASFINQAESAEQRRLLKRIAPEFVPTEVTRILFEMNVNLMERLFIRPGIKTILKECAIHKSVTDTNYKKYYSSMISKIACELKGLSYSIRYNSKFEFVNFVRWAYRESVSMRSRPSRSADPKSLETILRERSNGTARTIFEVSDLLEDPIAFKSLKSDGIVSIEELRYLVDVADFVNMRIDNAATSFDVLVTKQPEV